MAWGLGGGARRPTTSTSDSARIGAWPAAPSVADLGGDGAGRATTSTAGFKTPTELQEMACVFPKLQSHSVG